MPTGICNGGITVSAEAASVKKMFAELSMQNELLKEALGRK
jgi:hypothetical protein